MFRSGVLYLTKPESVTIYCFGCFDLHFIFHKLCFVNHHLYEGQLLISLALMSIVLLTQKQDNIYLWILFILNCKHKFSLNHSYVIITIKHEKFYCNSRCWVLDTIYRKMFGPDYFLFLLPSLFKTAQTEKFKQQY